MSSTQSRTQKFEVGDCVQTSKGEKCIIRYIGKVNGLSNSHNNNILYGIEYIDGTIGQHNGKYKGKKYFIGLHKRCSFIRYDQIRKKTKYYNIKNSLKKSNSVKKKSTKTTNFHSNNTFTSQYTNSKRKSLPTKLNEFNHKKVKNKKANKNTLELKRRGSASNKNKNKNLFHLDEFTKHNHKTNNNRRKSKQLKISKKNSKKNSKIRATSMHNALRTNSKKSKKVIPNLKLINPKSQIQKRRNAAANLDNKCIKNRSKSIVKQAKKRKHKHNYIEECSKYKHEKIHFSQMDMLHLINTDTFKTEMDDMNHMTEDNQKRKNAYSQIILSQRSLNEYHLKRNLLIGDIFVGNQYLLKNGTLGICLYVGALHWINNGKMSAENEYIGIALQKGKGRHDGEYKGKRYFQCQRRCGIFVKRNKLWKDYGPVSHEEIEKVTTRKRKRGGLLYDDESDISDLSDVNNEIDTDSDDTHSGHSDFECDNINIDDVEDDNDTDIVSYIDLFSPPTDNNMMSPIDLNEQNDIIITPTQYKTDNELFINEKENKSINKINKTQKILRLKTKTKKKSKTRQSRSISADQSKTPRITSLKKRKSISRTIKNKNNTTKNCTSLQIKMEKYGFKNNYKKKNSTTYQSQTPKVNKRGKMRKKSITKRKTKANALKGFDNMTNIEDIIKSNKTKRKNNNILNECPLSAINNNTKFPFDRNLIAAKNNNTKNESITDYKPVLTKKRSRRNATPIVSIPSLIGKHNFMSLLNDNTKIKDEKRNVINDLCFDLTSKSLTPLPSQD